MPRISLLLVCLVLPLILACGGDTTQPVPPPAPPPPGPPPPPPPPPAPVATVTLDPASATLVPQQTTLLSATTRDAAGNVLTGRTITWSSNTQTAAAVSAGGLVTGVGPGSATITATSEGQSGTATVTINDGGFVPTAGGTVTAGGGTVQITIPGGAVTSALAIQVSPLASPPAHTLLVPGSAVAIGPPATTFAQPVTVKLAWPDAPLPGDLEAEFLRVHRHDGATWIPLAGGTVDVASRTAIGTTTSLGPFAIIQLAPNPAPVLTALSPTSAEVEGPAFTLTATGTGFSAGSEVRWNGSARPTTFVSATALTAQIAVSDLLAPGTALVTVSSPGPGGGLSSELPFSISATIGEFLASKVWAGGAHSCGMTLTDGLYCWGWNDDGQLGNGSTVDADHPVKVAGGHAFAAFSPGFYHSCAVTGSGTAYCWGWGHLGRLGTGNSSSRNEPTAVTGGFTWASVSAGAGHSCGVTVAGTGYCWGWNVSARLGTGLNVAFLTTPTEVAGGHTFGEIAAGGDFSCGLTSAGAGLCWGEGRDGQLGTGTMPTPVNAPVAVTGSNVFSSIVAGLHHACAIATSGITYCWGRGANGRLGNQMTADLSSPVEVQGGMQFARISAGSEHTCGLTAAGVAYCWGMGSLGRLGHGTTEDKSVPTLVAGGHVFATISAGDEHSCGTTTANEVYCWGWADALGDGSNVDQLVPVRVVFAAPNGAPSPVAQPGRDGPSTQKGDATTIGRPTAGRRR